MKHRDHSLSVQVIVNLLGSSLVGSKEGEATLSTAYQTHQKSSQVHFHLVLVAIIFIKLTKRAAHLLVVSIIFEELSHFSTLTSLTFFGTIMHWEVTRTLTSLTPR